MRLKPIAAILAAAFAMPAAADDMATVMAEMKRLAARVEALEQQNKALEKALASGGDVAVPTTDKTPLSIKRRRWNPEKGAFE